MNVIHVNANQSVTVVVVNMEKITKDTRISEVVQSKPEAIELLFKAGMGCIGCPMAQMETIEQGCKAHDMSDKEIQELVEKINESK